MFLFTGVFQLILELYVMVTVIISHSLNLSGSHMTGTCTDACFLVVVTSLHNPFFFLQGGNVESVAV